ncbi:MAG: substrate-binding domain-containing protein [Anaerolineae bacterium]|nr:substrate-binding domain-containing protein [Anaerolineae bacterium]
MNSSFHLRRIISVLLLCLTVVGCAATAPTPTPTNIPTSTLTITGSGTVSSLLSALQPAFEADVKTVRLKVLSGAGTSAAIKGVLEGSVDIAAVARQLKEEETKQGLKYKGFGQAAVVLLVRPDSTISNLTTAQVVDVFAGKITNWSAVGGPDQKIVLFVRDEEESATQALRKVILGKTPFPEGGAKVFTSPKELYVAVEGTANSVGFGIWPGVLANAAKVKPLNLDENSPTSASYPVLLPIGISYHDKQQAAAQPLIDWLDSEHGRQELQRFGVILAK